jgi:hypothetical protein
MSKDDIAGMFERVTREIHPDLTAVIGKAEQRGRRLRARRRVAIVLTAIASATAISIAATLGTRLALRDVPGPLPAGPGQDSSQSHRIRPASHRPQEAHGPGMTHRQLFAVLRSMLPPGAVFSHIKGGFPNDTPGGLELNYNDGKGAADISLTVAPTQKFGPPPSPGPIPPNLPARAKREIQQQEHRALQQYWEIRRNLCPSPLWRDDGQRPVGALPISCARRVLADGSVERDAVSYADAAGFYGYLIEDRRPDGITVWLQVGNGTLAGSPHYARPGWPYVDRARPPGSMALWTSVVDSPEWHL